jgi:pimeloyl-ACP methyl ester carboxylesterase
MTPPPAEPRAQDAALYDFGETIVFALAKDPRFSYCLYVPRQLGPRTELLVMVHGTGRAFMSYRDQFSAFGRWNDCVILCPLFPAGVLCDGNRDGFKHLREGTIRYDQLLLDMVEEVGAKYGQRFEQFALAGYSGGGQYVNRFAFLHPQRLWALSIGAPGSVTLLDADRRWWVGTGGMQELFDIAPDLNALRRVPVQLVVGAADVETWEITHREWGKHWMPGANDAGRTRVERAGALQRSLQAAGVDARLDVLPNIPHDGAKCVPAMEDFFAEQLQARRAAMEKR